MFASEAEIPELLYETKETNRILIEAIKKLPKKEKAVIEHIFYKGLTALETGKLLGISEQGVNKRKRSAFEKIKSEFGFGISKNFPI